MSEQPSVDAVRGKHPTEDLIYDRLVEAITDKHLRPSEHLNEVKLAEAYNVPRSRVRRVLERLRDEHVVVFELNRGAFISRPTPADARDVFEARRYLECTMVRLACERADDRDIEELRQHLALEYEAFHAHRPSVNRTAGQFHVLVARVARNPVLERMLSVLIRRCVLVQSVYEKKIGELCLTHEHSRLVDFIAARRADDAVTEMNSHFDHIIGSLDLSDEQHGSADIYQAIRG
jgi:DNA-binding GntR family transcriptional regulator